MKAFVPGVLLALLSTSALAQTKPAAKPVAKPAAKAPATKPASKPAPAPAKPAAAPAPAPAPAAAPAPATTAAEPLIPAQGAVSFAKGTTAINLGVGFGIGYGYGFGFGGTFRSTPALSLSVEKGISDNVGPGVISVGGLIGYKGYSYNWGASSNGDYKANWHNFIATARGAYHYNFTSDPKLDTYAGVSLGLRFMSYSDNYSGALSTSYNNQAYLASGLFVGARYMLTDNLGGFAEVGYDMSYLKIGVTSKF